MKKTKYVVCTVLTLAFTCLGIYGLCIGEFEGQALAAFYGLCTWVKSRDYL